MPLHLEPCRAWKIFLIPSFLKHLMLACRTTHASNCYHQGNAIPLLKEERPPGQVCSEPVLRWRGWFGACRDLARMIILRRKERPALTTALACCNWPIRNSNSRFMQLLRSDHSSMAWTSLARWKAYYSCKLKPNIV